MDQRPESPERLPGSSMPEQQAEESSEANNQEGSRAVDDATQQTDTGDEPSGAAHAIQASSDALLVGHAPGLEPPKPKISFSRPAGTYDAPFVLTLKCSIPRSTIYYTLDGSTPHLASSRSSADGFRIDRSVTVVARVCVNGQLRDAPERAQYTLRTGRVVFSMASGTYHPPLTVALSTQTDGAAIFYTLDGSEPTTASNHYDVTDPLLLRTSVAVKAFAWKEGWESCDVCTADYDLKAPRWRELDPVEQNDPVSHEAAESFEGPNDWTILAASVRGKLHAHNALWRDDAFGFKTAGPWTILAVSDGAGSAPSSRIGSRIACDRAIEYLVELLNGYRLQEAEDARQPELSDLVRLREFLASAAQQAKIAIKNEATKRKTTLGHFAATLLLVVHCQWKTYHFAAAIQVGDGAIALWHQDDTASLLCVADHGEHSGETKFLTTNEIEQEFLSRVLFAMKEQLRGIAVMTDGVSEDFFPEDRRIAELFTGRAIAGLSGSDDAPVDGVAHTVLMADRPDVALLDWLKYNKRGSSDDRTLVLFFRR